MEKFVNLRAELEFYRHYQGKTVNKTAILILIYLIIINCEGNFPQERLDRLAKLFLGILAISLGVLFFVDEYLERKKEKQSD